MYWRNDELQFTSPHLKPNKFSSISTRTARIPKQHSKQSPSWCYPPSNKLNFSPQGQREHTAKWKTTQSTSEHLNLREPRAGLPLPPVYPTLKEAVDKLKENTASRSSEEEQQRKKKMQKDHCTQQLKLRENFLLLLLGISVSHMSDYSLAICSVTLSNILPIVAST